MLNCLFCYEAIDQGEYHSSCSKKFFDSSVVPELDISKERLEVLAKSTVNERLAMSGVQPKLSLTVEGTGSQQRLTLVGLWGDYILKPQSDQYVQMPEVEDLTMHLASLFKIKTAEHALIGTKQGELAYITKRFDRHKGEKIHLEDACQLSGLLTEQKYKSSYERIGKLIQQYSTYPGLDTVNYFKLVLFSFLTGNNDMHLKNFSLLHSEKGIILSPAYDLLNVNLVFPLDKEELALTLNGKKSNIKKQDFDILAKSLKINDKVRDNVYKIFASKHQEVNDWIDRSFLTSDFKEGYKQIIDSNFRKLKLSS